MMYVSFYFKNKITNADTAYLSDFTIALLYAVSGAKKYPSRREMNGYKMMFILRYFLVFLSAELTNLYSKIDRIRKNPIFCIDTG